MDAHITEESRACARREARIARLHREDARQKRQRIITALVIAGLFAGLALYVSYAG